MQSSLRVLIVPPIWLFFSRNMFVCMHLHETDALQSNSLQNNISKIVYRIKECIFHPSVLFEIYLLAQKGPPR